MATRVELASKPRPRLPLLRTFYWFGVISLVISATEIYSYFQLLKSTGEHPGDAARSIVEKSDDKVLGQHAQQHMQQVHQKAVQVQRALDSQLKALDVNAEDVSRIKELEPMVRKENAHIRRLAVQQLLQFDDEESRRRAAYYTAQAEMFEKGPYVQGDKEMRDMRFRRGRWRDADAFAAAKSDSNSARSKASDEDRNTKTWAKSFGFSAGPFSAGMRGSASVSSPKTDAPSSPARSVDSPKSNLIDDTETEPHEQTISKEDLVREMAEMERRERENKARMLNDYDAWLKESTDDKTTFSTKSKKS